MAVYIDPVAGDDGTADETSILTPRKTWPNSWAASTVYYQKAGTTSTRDATITYGGNDITMGAYGTGERPYIECTKTDGHAVTAVERTGIVITGLKISSAATATYAVINVYAAVATSDPQITDCEIVGGYKGIQVGGSVTWTSDNVLIKDNIVHGSANDAIFFQSIGSARILNNTTYDTGDDGIAVVSSGTANEVAYNTCTNAAGTKQPLIITNSNPLAPAGTAFAWIHHNTAIGGIYCLNVKIGARVECNTLIGMGAGNTMHINLDPSHANQVIQVSGNHCSGTVVTNGSIVCTGESTQGTFRIYNNTVDASTPRGIWLLTSITTATVTARNNRLIGRSDAGSIGIAAHADDWGQLTESNSAVSGFATSIGTGGTLDTTSNTTGAYAGLGVWIAGVRGYDDLPLPLTPDIGAVQDRNLPGRRFGVGSGTL